jgi:integrase
LTLGEDFFRGKTFALISPLMVEKFKRTLREAETNRGTRFSPRHVNYHLQILFRIFSLAIERNEVAAEDNPCKRVKFLAECSRRTRYLLDEEEPRLSEHLVDERAHLREMVTVAVGTGMRLGDQLNLKKSKVDFQRNIVLVPNSKTGRDYPVPMNQEVREALLKLARQNPSSEYVFVNPKTGRPYRCIKRAFKKACELAKIDDLHWHDLRHTFGTRLAEGGFSEATIAELMGHTDPKTTRPTVPSMRPYRRRARARTSKKSRKKTRRRRSSRWGDERVCPIFAPRQKRPSFRVAVNRGVS